MRFRGNVITKEDLRAYYISNGISSADVEEVLNVLCKDEKVHLDVFLTLLK